MNVTDSKAAARKEITRRLELLDGEYLAQCDENIARNITGMPEYKKCSVFFCFCSWKTEISTKALIEQALSDGKEVALPVTLPGGEMFFRLVVNTDCLRPGRYGILEPDADCPIVTPHKGDFAAVPGMSFDSQCRRLGRGGGYYDRWLAKNPVFSAGVCRERLMLDSIPWDMHDVSVDAVVTERRIIRK